MQLSEMVTQVAFRCGDPNKTSTTEAIMKQYINESMQKLARIMYEMGDQKISTTTVTTSAGTQEYNLPEDFYMARRVYITDEVELGFSNVRNKGLDKNRGQPSSYYLQNNYSSIGAGPTVTYVQIGFIPNPDAAYTYNIDYFPIIADMAVDTDVCLIPVDFHWLIVAMACLKIRRNQGQRGMVRTLGEEVKEGIEDFKSRYGQRQRYDTGDFYSVYGGLTYAEEDIV